MAGCIFFLLERPPAACLCGSACKWSGDCLRSMLPWQLTKGQHLPTADAPSAGRLREMERATSLSRSIPHLWTGANIAIAPPNRTLVCRSSQLYIRGNSIELAWFAPKLHIDTCIAETESAFLRWHFNPLSLERTLTRLEFVTHIPDILMFAHMGLIKCVLHSCPRKNSLYFIRVAQMAHHNILPALEHRFWEFFVLISLKRNVCLSCRKFI